MSIQLHNPVKIYCKKKKKSPISLWCGLLAQKYFSSLYLLFTKAYWQYSKKKCFFFSFFFCVFCSFPSKKGKNHHSEVQISKELILLRSDQLATLHVSAADRNIADLVNIHLKKYCIGWQTVGDDEQECLW